MGGGGKYGTKKDGEVFGWQVKNNFEETKGDINSGLNASKSLIGGGEKEGFKEGS